MSSSLDTSDYVLFEGLSIEMTASGNEVFFTPDIEIDKEVSMANATSSMDGETGAPVVKHLSTFSREEAEKLDMFPYDENEDTENACPSGHRQPQVTNQRQILNVITSIVPPTDTKDPRSPRERVLGELSMNSPQNALQEKKKNGLKVQAVPPIHTVNDDDDVIIPSWLDPRSPVTSPKNRNDRDLKVDTFKVKKNELPLSNGRSPRVLGEMRINSPQNVMSKKDENYTPKLSVQEKIQRWDNVFTNRQA